MSERCTKCGANLKCASGESAHPKNWYCPQCQRIAELEEMAAWRIKEIVDLEAENDRMKNERAELEAKDKRWQDEMDIACKKVLTMHRKVKAAEAALREIKKVHLFCDSVDWCGKSPTKNDLGLCPACEIRAILDKYIKEVGGE
jgi:acetone carboxylase gamma subunit